MNYQLHLSLFTGILCNSFQLIEKKPIPSAACYIDFMGAALPSACIQVFIFLIPKCKLSFSPVFSLKYHLCVTDGAFFPSVHAVKKIKF